MRHTPPGHRPGSPKPTRLPYHPPATVAEALALVEHHFQHRTQGALRKIDPLIHVALQLLGTLAATAWDGSCLRKASGYELYQDRPDIVRRWFATVYELVRSVRASSGDV